MLNLSKKRGLILLGALLLISLGVSLVLLNLVRFKGVEKLSPKKEAPVSTPTEKRSSKEISVTSSADVLEVKKIDKKTVKGSIRKLTAEAVLIGDAFEEKSLKLGPVNRAILTIYKQNLDPKTPPSLPVVKEIELKELKVGDSATLELEDRGQGFVVTSIQAERRE